MLPEKLITTIEVDIYDIKAYLLAFSFVEMKCYMHVGLKNLKTVVKTNSKAICLFIYKVNNINIVNEQRSLTANKYQYHICTYVYTKLKINFWILKNSSRDCSSPHD